MNTWQSSYRLIRNTPRLYALTSLMWVGVHMSWLIPGWITRNVLDELSGSAQTGWNVWTWIALLSAFGVVRLVHMMLSFLIYKRFRDTLAGTLQLNMLNSILSKPGAAALPNSAGEAVSRFSGDVDMVTEFVSDRLIDMWGLIGMPIVALSVLFSINPQITIVVVIPMLITLVLTNLLRRRLQEYRAQRRRASSRVIGFIAEMYGAVQAVKVANAESGVGARLAELNEERRKASLQDTLWSELSATSFLCTVEISTAIILIMASRAMSVGQFTVGDFALFTAYLWEATEGLTFIGRSLAVQKQTDVSLDRMARLVDYDPTLKRDSDFVMKPEQEKAASLLTISNPARPEGYERLLTKTQVCLNGEFPPIAWHPKQAADRLTLLQATNLTYVHPSSGRGVRNVSLNLRRGSFTVVTGRIGSGKTTLLRMLLGLLPLDSGEIRWNDEVISERDRFFVPPRAAYTSQVPRLFSDSLRQNILMGMPEGEVDVEGALFGAVMEKDLGDLENGLETTVGPRGVKLSGGQIQRAAAARTLARRPELYVFDDLSSALDVETERVLWERLFAKVGENTNDELRITGHGQNGQNGQNGHNSQPAIRNSQLAIDLPTCLVVSHRRAALRRADHILVLKDGHVQDEGSLEELLLRCEEMQRLWHGDVAG